jgi:hypothetical protein
MQVKKLKSGSLAAPSKTQKVQWNKRQARKTNQREEAKNQQPVDLVTMGPTKLDPDPKKPPELYPLGDMSITI